jgi:hypothetical protein
MRCTIRDANEKWIWPEFPVRSLSAPLQRENAVDVWAMVSVILAKRRGQRYEPPNDCDVIAEKGESSG